MACCVAGIFFTAVAVWAARWVRVHLLGLPAGAEAAAWRPDRSSGGVSGARHGNG